MAEVLNVLDIPLKPCSLSCSSFVQALAHREASNIFLHATHEKMLELVDLDTLKAYALDL